MLLAMSCCFARAGGGVLLVPLLSMVGGFQFIEVGRSEQDQQGSAVKSCKPASQRYHLCTVGCAQMVPCIWHLCCDTSILLNMCRPVLVLSKSCSGRASVPCDPYLELPLHIVGSAVLVVQAVALSNVACLASAVTNLMFNISRKNPVKPGPLIDYDLLLLVSLAHSQRYQTIMCRTGSACMT